MSKELTTQPPISDATALMAVISKAATDPNVDVTKMQGMFDLYRQMDDRRAERDFNAALQKAQQEIPAIFKNKKADKNKYADLEQVNDIVVPISTANGFSLSFGNEDSPVEKHYRIICFVSHTGGHTRKYHADIPIDNSGSKNVTQGFGSTVSYGRRYLTLMIFNLSTTDEDNDGAGGKITDAQAQHLAGVINEVGADVSKFLKFLNVDTLENLLASKYDAALRALESKRAKP
jgi:hypothetical protein